MVPTYAFVWSSGTDDDSGKTQKLGHSMERDVHKGGVPRKNTAYEKSEIPGWPLT